MLIFNETIPLHITTVKYIYKFVVTWNTFPNDIQECQWEKFKVHQALVATKMLILANFIVSFGFKGDMKCEGEKEGVALFKQKVMLESFGPCPTLAVINSSFVTVPFCTLYTLKQVNVIDFGQFSSDTHIQLYIYIYNIHTTKHLFHPSRL